MLLPLIIRERELSCRCVLEFVTLVCGIFFFFLINGYITEDLFRTPGFRPFGWFLTLVQLLVYLLLSAFDLLRQRKLTTKSRVPLGLLFMLGVLTVCSTGLSNVSVGYLNYPTQLIFKSCKIIPVMIGGVILLGKQYRAINFFAAGCMTVGLIFFSLADAQISPDFEVKGIVLVSLSLIGDAAIGNAQEKIFKVHSISNSEMLFYTSFTGSLIILTGLIISGQLNEAIEFCDQHSNDGLYTKMLLFGVCGFFGVNLILVLLRSFGAVAAVCVTTCRKAITLCLSFMIFVKPFSMQYVWSGALVIFGIFLNLYASHQSATHRVLKRSYGSFKKLFSYCKLSSLAERWFTDKNRLYVM